MIEDPIYNLLEKNIPCMIARFGANEIKVTTVMHLKKPIVSPFLSFLENRMYIQSGFFPSNFETLKRFSELMMEDIKQVDILGSWRMEELLLKKSLKNIRKVPLTTLEPYFSNQPWSRILEGKKVLVVHPFSESIEYQYAHSRQLLFPGTKTLPLFASLQTIKAVQSIAGTKTRFQDWFAALDFMKGEIATKDFDIAIIGCGAYGFPLAAYVKRLGKQAFHLGGATQILFGIKGRRWVDDHKFDKIINKSFIYPLESERPKNAEEVENGCYW